MFSSSDFLWPESLSVALWSLGGSGRLDFALRRCLSGGRSCDDVDDDDEDDVVVVLAVA